MKLYQRIVVHHCSIPQYNAKQLSQINRQLHSRPFNASIISSLRASPWRLEQNKAQQRTARQPERKCKMQTESGSERGNEGVSQVSM